MDSLTHIVMGASVGDVLAGRKLGNKAMIWGAIAGTIPDLDTLANPWLDTVEQLSFHRSLTHSLLFAILVSPLLGLLLRRMYRQQDVSFRTWTLLFFFGITTHSLLDSFTTWGTQVLWPFSNYGFAFYNLFVVDPFFTVPFLLCVLAAAFYARHKPTRRRLVYAGLGISSVYILFSFVAKAAADNIFRKSLQQQQISYLSFISKPTPMNTIFWSATAKDEKGFYNGFYSLLDEDETVAFDFVPQQAELLQPYRGHPTLERLLEITKGYYAVVPSDEAGVLIRDLRFGKFDGWREQGGQYVFVYHVWQDEQGQLKVEEINNRPKIDAAYLKSYLQRIRGIKG
ncbi:metal-dependent hydrolase [Pontibacter brevis]